MVPGGSKCTKLPSEMGQAYGRPPRRPARWRYRWRHLALKLVEPLRRDALLLDIENAC